MMRCLVMLVVCACTCVSARAASTVRLPAGVCAADDTIYFDAFEGVVAVPTEPSQGSGGAAPGSLTGSVNVPGLGQLDYYLRIPPQYDPSRSWPVLFALHGYAGSSVQAVTAAKAVRANWAGWADAQGFIVVAPVGGDVQGSWIVPPTSPNDYDGFAAVLADVETRYNVERSRVYLWGFSAGGHVAFDLVFNAPVYATPLNESNLAGLAVSAGALSQFACNPQVAGWCDSLVAAMPRRLPIDVHVGLTDPLLSYARYDRDRLLAHGWALASTLGYHEFAGGHSYATAQLGEAWAQICRYAKGP